MPVARVLQKAKFAKVKLESGKRNRFLIILFTVLQPYNRQKLFPDVIIFYFRFVSELPADNGQINSALALCLAKLTVFVPCCSFHYDD